MNQLLLNAILAGVLAFANGVLAVMTSNGGTQLPSIPAVVAALLGGVVAFVLSMQQTRNITEETVRALKGRSLKKIFRIE